MKQSRTQRALAISALVICANFSEQRSVRKEKPDVNFSGTITTQANTNMKAENITLGGKYEQINAYDKPAAEMDPKKSSTSLDFGEISKISIKSPKQALFTYCPPQEIETKEDGTTRQKTPKPIEYIELNATYKNGETRSYLVERDRKFWFDEMVGNNRVEHRPNVESIQQIIIEKTTSGKDDEVKNGTPETKYNESRYQKVN